MSQEINMHSRSGTWHGGDLARAGLRPRFHGGGRWSKVARLLSQIGRASPRRKTFCLVSVGAALALALAPGAALAGPVWDLESHHAPTNWQAGGTGELHYILNNVGDAPASGPIDVEIRLPPGVSTRLGSPGLFPPILPDAAVAAEGWSCSDPNIAGASSIQCSAAADPVPHGGFHLGRITLFVGIAPGVTGPLVAEATVRGGAEEAIAREDIAVGPPVTHFGVAPNTFEADAFDKAGNPVRQAGAHPYRATVEFDMNLQNVDAINGLLRRPVVAQLPNGTPRNIEVTLPRGFVGNPQAVDQCTPVQMAESFTSGSECPIDSQIGNAEVVVQNLNGLGINPVVVRQAVYNMVPPKGRVAQFGFQVEGRPVFIQASLDPKDYSIVTTVPNVNEMFPLHYQKLTLWGVPADPAHDVDRWNPTARSWGASSSIRPRPFLTLPSECDVPGTTKVRMTSWQGDADPPAAEAAAGARIESAPQVLRGCEKQRFNASLQSQPDTGQTDAPTGLNVQLDIDQDENPVGLGTPPLRQAVVALPEGMSVSPSSATGLGGCAPAEIGLKTNDEATCPDASKVGTVSIRTPVLPDPLEGSIYLARQNDNPFRSLLALYIVARGPGIIVKLPGKVTPDPSTGQLTAVFEDNPQLPFNRLDLRFKGGQRGTLATPTTCGEKTTRTVLAPWNGVLPPVESISTYTASLDGRGAPCPAVTPFDARFDAGMVNAGAGQDSTFTMTLGRADRNQFLNGIRLTTPEGLLGRIASATLCNDAAANAGTCPAGSKIGSATVAAGPGTEPFWLSGGRVYITRSYKGAPYGLSIATRALAGPFDLGEVIVRAAIYVDPNTAALTIVSDPVPSMLEGIPLRLRTINVAIDRPGFMFNPTNCSPKSIAANITSTGGAAAQRSSRFQVGGCGDLPVRPRMTIEIGRRGHTGREAVTPLRVTLTQTRGQSNLKSVKVDLPTTVNARLRVVNQACTLAAFNSNTCGARARIGSAVVVTPLLRDPLRGEVFFVRSGIRRLPDIMIALRGDVSVNLIGKITIPGGRRLATTFDTVPDVPFTSFTLKLVDGVQGPVGAVSNLCVARNRKPPANIEFRSQSGRTVRVDQKLIIRGCGRAATRGRARARGRNRAAGRSRRARGRRAARARRSS